RRRPRSVLGIINEPLAAGVIYPAVLAAWLFLVRLPHGQVHPAPKVQVPGPPIHTPKAEVPLVSILVFVGGLVLTVIYNVVIDQRRPKLLYELFLGKAADQPSKRE